MHIQPSRNFHRIHQQIIQIKENRAPDKINLTRHYVLLPRRKNAPFKTFASQTTQFDWVTKGTVNRLGYCVNYNMDIEMSQAELVQEDASSIQV